MVAMEFVESSEQQGLKRFAEEGRSAAVCLRLTEAWHNKVPRLLLADAWFGGVPSAFALAKRDIYRIMNVKLQTKHFCKQELWADARGEQAVHTHNDCADRQLTMKVNGRNMAFTGAFHMDKRPMTLLCKAGSSKKAPEVMRRRVYMDADGDLVRWHGKLEQPDAHYIYRSNFNAVDVHNKLAVGPRSVCSVGANSLVLKFFLSVVAFAETDAYLMYVKHHKLSSDEYNHSDFKVDLDSALMQCAQQGDEWPSASREAEGMVTRQSVAMVATGGTARNWESVHPMFAGHALRRQETNTLKCIICGTKTKSLCECGRAVCGTAGGVGCWSWHLGAVATGTASEQPMRWPRSKRSRE
jgi:hypothetical protein